MNPSFCRRLFFAALIFMISASIAEAQKTKKPVKKTNPKIVEKVEPKAEVKTKPTVEEKIALSALESQIFAELNKARNEPQSFIVYLEEYKKYLKGNTLSMPNKTAMVMIEGLPAIEDAISDLKKNPKQTPLTFSNGLTKVARNQLADLLENPSLKHLGKDGSPLDRRMMKVGFTDGAIAENISQRVEDAREVILTMIVDDGLKSRSHRKNVFSPTFKLFGIACGLAQNNNTICVAEFADGFQEKK